MLEEEDGANTTPFFGELGSGCETQNVRPTTLNVHAVSVRRNHPKNGSNIHLSLNIIEVLLAFNRDAARLTNKQCVPDWLSVMVAKGLQRLALRYPEGKISRLHDSK